MRLFIAIKIPKEISEKLRLIQLQFKGLAKIKFVNSFHCTLKFLGEVDEELLDKIKNKLNGIKFHSFKTKIKDIGSFPNNKRIEVVWVGINGKIMELQKEIDGNLLNLFPNDEKFHGHITLGRVKFIKKKDEFMDKLKIRFEEELLINEFELIRSDLSKDGSRYTVLEAYKLT